MYDCEDDGKIVCILIAVVLVLGFGIYSVISHCEAKRTAQNNQCIDAGGVPLVVNAEVKCFTELNAIQLRKE